MQSTSPAQAPTKIKKINTVPIEAIIPNPDNPRTISQKELSDLIRSIIKFPKMMYIRGIVVDKTMMAIGGNQRLNAISHIIDMPEEELTAVLSGHPNELESYAVWTVIRETKSLPAGWIIDGSQLTEQEIREFVVKDNVSAGSFDWDALTKQYGNDDLIDWGLIETQIQEAGRIASERFDIDDDQEEGAQPTSGPSGSSEGFTTYTVVIPVSLNDKISRIINKVKAEKGFTTTIECLTEIFNYYESTGTE